MDGVCRALPQHIKLLDAWSRQLFGRGFAPDPKRLAQQIAAVVPTKSDLSQFVRLIVPADAELPYRLEFAGTSLYRGYALRSLMPKAVTLQYEWSLTEAPTSAREAVEAFAQQQAALRGASVVVRYDAQGIVGSADGAPLFAVRGHTICTSPASPSVERELGTEAIRTAGLELAEEPVRRTELARFDELFYIDYRGVTALSHCDARPFMSLIAERVAKAM